MPRPDLLSPAVPELSTTAGPLAGVLADVDDGAAVLALAVGGDGLEPGRPVDGALAALGLERSALVATHEPRAEAGAVVRIPLPPGGQPVRTLLLVGVGAATGADLRQAGAGLARAVKGRSTLITTLGGPAALTSAFVEGLVLGGYTVPRWGAGAPAASSAPVARV
ncbi:MAG: M17 family peptidase N-terminal domain-containing protein, partial [Lapillicoccus sp.]